MSRPCLCRQARPGFPYTPDQCHLCWVALNYAELGWSHHVLWLLTRRFARAVVRVLHDRLRRASRAEQRHRALVCARCPDNRHDHCQKCGCSLKGRLANKVLYRAEHCPVGKW